MNNKSYNVFASTLALDSNSVFGDGSGTLFASYAEAVEALEKVNGIQGQLAPNGPRPHMTYSAASGGITHLTGYVIPGGMGVKICEWNPSAERVEEIKAEMRQNANKSRP